MKYPIGTKLIPPSPNQYFIIITGHSDNDYLTDLYENDTFSRQIRFGKFSKDFLEEEYKPLLSKTMLKVLKEL